MTRVETCRACGGTIIADTRWPTEGVAEHIATPRHQAWRARRGGLERTRPCESCRAVRVPLDWTLCLGCSRAPLEVVA